ncbi:mandelate racemase/muconate lactonizing enzyme family protein [Rhizobium pusense]|uniref:mandelate racemase/muconate lactonizing enzyme family protein n=1 Tax=Agrobacterium pusense TaxID=648995 RepID=UPI001C6DEA18|nr:mandelate racemase/muconate lactonizing enzyme family protein [Agrobacterium pusense]MBW9076360.1 mandelate racemase/muconate lactonizing enzyme family protein [Agrobacterium pusense]
MKVKNVNFFLLRYPLERRYGNASGLKTERVSLVIRLETSDGVTGWGEGFAERTYPHHWEEAAKIIRGSELHDAPNIVDRIAKFDIALAGGVDVALWDLRGKLAGMSVANLLGGAYRNSQPAYASLHNVNDEPDIVKSALEESQSALDAGFRALKMKVGWHPVETDIAWVNAVTEALSPGVSLALDANRSMDLPTARRFIRALKDPGAISWFEEPVANTHSFGYSDLRNSIDIAIAGGETMSAPMIQEVIRQRAMDIINPDLVGHGGFRRMTHFWHAASVNGLRLIPHVFDGQISRVAALHFLASQPDWSETRSHFRAPPLEYDTAHNPLRDEILCENLVPLEDGSIAVPSGPGLGVEVNDSLVRKYTVAQG